MIVNKRTNWKRIAEQLAQHARPVARIIDGHIGIVWVSNLKWAIKQFDEAVERKPMKHPGFSLFQLVKVLGETEASFDISINMHPAVPQQALALEHFLEELSAKQKGHRMPQASDELRAKFPGHDQEAWEVLKEHFDDDRGMIRRKDKTRQPTEREFEAIDYLCDEWDYCFEGIPK